MPGSSHQLAGAPWAVNEPGSTLGCLTSGCIYIAKLGKETLSAMSVHLRGTSPVLTSYSISRQ